MLNEEVMNLTGDNNPVLCADGKFGMLLIYPRDDGLCGVQVSGEDEHRWIPSADLSATDGGALRQSGSTECPSETSDMVQAMMFMDWKCRGGI